MTQSRRTIEYYRQIADEAVGPFVSALDEDEAERLLKDTVDKVALIRNGLVCGGLATSTCITCCEIGLGREQRICAVVDVPEALPTFSDYGRANY